MVTVHILGGQPGGKNAEETAAAAVHTDDQDGSDLVLAANHQNTPVLDQKMSTLWYLYIMWTLIK